MIREIVKIDDNLCDGCGLCIPECHEGALQIIDGKARLVSDLMCDGLGACLGHCPQGAITIEKREAEEYDELKVIEEMTTKGENVVLAHLKHLKDHNEKEFLRIGIQYLSENKEKLDFNVEELIKKLSKSDSVQEQSACGCPGSQERSFGSQTKIKSTIQNVKSELTQWPVQMHLINPASSIFQAADLLLAADCVAFSYGNFHNDFLKGKKLIIACPKLDSGTDSYVQKITQLIETAKVNTITVMMMQVPCCSGLIQLVQTAMAAATRKVPVKSIIIGIEGQILSENWI